MIDLEGIALALDPKAKKTGQQYKLHCPVHEDATPSAYLTVKEGQLLWHCFGCGDQEGFRKAIEDTGLYKYTPSDSSLVNIRRGQARDKFIDKIKAAIREEKQIRHWRPLARFNPYAAGLPPPKTVTGPFQTHSSGFIAAPGGSGKSMFTLGLAHALTQGEDFCGWQTEKPASVYLLDVEMSDPGLFSRLHALGISGELPLVLDTSDQRDAVDMPRFQLGPEEHTHRLMADAEKADVIIIDNVSACLQPTRSGELFSPETWQQVFPLEQWARQRGKLLIFVDHTNKGGQLAGSLHKHRMADFVCLLERTSLLGEPWLEFLFWMDKCRYDADPEDMMPRLVRLEDGRWSTSDPQATDDDIMIQVMEGSMTKTAAAEELDITRKTLDKRLRKYTMRLRSKQRNRD